VDDGLFCAIQELEPFGEGHQAPLFAVAGRLDLARAVGATRTTLQLRVGGIKGVAWQLGDLAGQLPLGGNVNVAATIRESEWRQQKELELLAQAVRAGGRLGLEAAARGAASAAAALLVGRAAGLGSLGPAASSAGEDSNTPVASGVAEPFVRVVTGPLLEPVPALEALVAGGEPFVLDLTEHDLAAIEDEALSYPTVHELRRGLVAFRRGTQHGIPEPKLGRLRTALLELGLIDGQ